MAIDIGLAAVADGNNFSATYTYIQLDNPANATGTITQVQVYADISITGMRAGTFYNTGANTYKCRASAALGDAPADQVTTFPGLSIAVVAGDFIGGYHGTGYMELTVDATKSFIYVSGEFIDADDETTYSAPIGRHIALYGTGVEAGWTGTINLVVNPAKVNLIAKANIASINGI